MLKLGTVGEDGCLGEEPIFDKKRSENYFETAYAESDFVQLVEFDNAGFQNLKEMFFESGLRKDYLILEGMMRKCFIQKKIWR